MREAKITILLAFLLAMPICAFSQDSQKKTIIKKTNNIDYDEEFAAGVIGYVNKTWRTDFGDRVVNENIWGEEDKRIHGVQIGIDIHPCLPMGLGIKSGLFYEFYYSESQSVKDAGYDDFREHNLYLPIHALYRIPFSRLVSLNFYGGIGFNWAMWGTYNNDYILRNGYGQREKDSRIEAWHKYGNGENPRHLNAQWEAGCFIKYKWFQLGFTYSRGLTDHHLYNGYKTQQNKIGIAFGLELNEDL